MMMHKIRVIMGMCDDNYDLEGVVELDDAIFKIHSEEEKLPLSKRGRGTNRKSKVLVMVKVEPYPTC